MRHFSSVVFLALLVIPAVAHAQLMLPGALQAQPPAAGKSASNPAGSVSGQPKLERLKPPSEEAILGRDLARDGYAGIIAFQRGLNQSPEITKLSFAGSGVSHPAEECRVNVVAEEPIQTHFAGMPKGVFRYDVNIEACPFSLDVLDGAVLISRAPRTCDFKSADCRVDPSGLWGPPGNTIGPGQTKDLERERSRSESEMRARFRALLERVGADQEAIKKFAGEQAAFSSEREMTCRDYLHEDVHGYCALRITQARAFALQAALEEFAKVQAATGLAKAMEKRKVGAKKPAANEKFEAKPNAVQVPGDAPHPEASSN